MSDLNTATVVLCLLLPVQAFILRLAQRRIFWDLERVGRSRFVAYAIAAPSTAAHELAHAAAAFILRVPFGRAVGGKVELFRPRRTEKGITLGQVSVAQTDPLRGSLISIAPFILVPLMMLGLNWLLLSEVAPADALRALGEAPGWKAALWVAASILLPLAAFPSPGDHIGVAGAVSLILLAALIGFVIVDQAGPAALANIAAAWSSALILPSAVCAVLLVAMTPGGPLRALRLANRR